MEPLDNLSVFICKNSMFNCLNYFKVLEGLVALKSKDVYKGVLFILSLALKFNPP